MASSDLRGRRTLLWLAALVALAAVVRAFHLDYKSFDGGDEPFSLALAQRSLGDMFSLFGYEANGMIYSIILWPLARISESEALMRAPAAVAGVLAVPALWWAGRELVNERVALMAAALMAVNPMAIFYSQYARPFSLIVPLACVTFASLALALRERRTRWWVIYVVAMVLSGYANVVAPFALLTGHAVIVYVTGRDSVRSWLISVGAFLVASVPLFVAIAIEHSRRDALYWLDRPGPGSLINAAKEFTAGSLEGSTPVFLVTTLLVAVLFAWLILRRRDGDATWPQRPLGVPITLWSWAFVPAVAVFLVSQITPLFRAAYIIAVLPGVLLFIAFVVDRLGGRTRWVVLGTLLSLAVAGTAYQTTHQVDENWRDAMRWIESERRPGDRVLVDAITVFPAFGYYDPDRYRAPNGDLIVREWGDHELPRDIVPLDTPGGYSGPPLGPPTKEHISRLASGRRRLFVAFAEYSTRIQGDLPSGPAMTWARKNCEVVKRPEVQIDLYLVSDCATL